MKILCTTKIDHLPDVQAALEALGPVEYDNATDATCIFCNPNNQGDYYGEELLSGYPFLRVICTASTGLTHIDTDYCAERGIDILHLAGDPVLARIPSTAEHAFGLMLAAVRDYPGAFRQIERGEWDWTALRPGRQLCDLTVLVVGGLGRLGQMMASYCDAFGMDVWRYDTIFDNRDYAQIRRGFPGSNVEYRDERIEDHLHRFDIISLHIPAKGNERLVDESWFAQMKPDAVLVNTSRGEVVDEAALLAWLNDHPQARYAADVITNEQTKNSFVWDVAHVKRRDDRRANQIILTPHIGGSTIDAQRIAYGRAVEKLRDWNQREERT